MLFFMNKQQFQNFAQMVKFTREQAGWSQNELAKRSQVALRTVVNTESAKSTRKVRFDVVIRLALAFEKSPREWLEFAGHKNISYEMISHVMKKAGILTFYGEDEPVNFLEHLEHLTKTSPPVIVSMTYCTYSMFARQEFLARRIAPLIDTGKLFLALVCAYPKISDIDKQGKSTLSTVYLEVRSELIGLAKAVKAQMTQKSNLKNVAAFSLKELPEPTCFPQVGLSQFRQILIQSFPDGKRERATSLYELSTWISFFQDTKERWIRIYPTPEIWNSQGDAFKKICFAWVDYLSEIHNNCDLTDGWRKDAKKFSPWEMADLAV